MSYFPWRLELGAKVFIPVLNHTGNKVGNVSTI